jgi:hypothetical protein
MIIVFNITGLVLNLVGVLLLFRYGMPYRVRTGGRIVTFTSVKPDLKTEKLDRYYDCLGYLGLVSVVLGTGAQVWACVMSR